MPKEDVLNIITGVAEALDYAHQQGLLHRDVKPANIMLSAPAEVVNEFCWATSELLAGLTTPTTSLRRI